MEKFKLLIFCVVALIVMIVMVFVFNTIVKEDQDILSKVEKITSDIGDYNNVSTIDAKLGTEDIKVTQSYLLNYTIKKGGTWYMSSGVIKSIKKNNDVCLIIVNSENDSNLTLSIDKEKCSVNKNDIVNFVGTIDIETGNLLLSKISLDSINYSSATTLSLDELINNINLVRSSYFVINGYMVTDNEEYKLYDSKDAYSNDSSVGNYFLLDWNGEFGYTGNSDVTVRCNILDTFKLHNCELVEK